MVNTSICLFQYYAAELALIHSFYEHAKGGHIRSILLLSRDAAIYTNKTGDCLSVCLSVYLFICSAMGGQTARPNGLKVGG